MRTVVVAAVVGVLCTAQPADGASLKGSRQSVAIQNRVAREHDFTYLKTPSQVRRFVQRGLLVRVPGNEHYELAGVSYPYARPELKLFIERLAAQYHRATGEKLVVTSLTRPLSRQPRNASRNSVHPTGMAADIRRSNNRRARAWIEKTLLSLERTGVLEATRERRPPHYHVAVFPRQYARYVTAKVRGDAARAYRVQRGDSLWAIARRHRTSVEEIRAMNGLRGNTIRPGQVLKVPTGSR